MVRLIDCSVPSFTDKWTATRKCIVSSNFDCTTSHGYLNKLDGVKYYKPTII